MAEFTAHFFYKFRFIFLWFLLASSAKNLLGFRQNLSSSQISCVVFFCCFVKIVEIKKYSVRLCRTISQIRGWKICTPRGYTKFFPLFFLFGAEYFLLELSGSMQLALARPHYDTLCRVQAPPESRTKNLASKNEGARPKLSWRLLSLSDLRLSQINANFT